VSKWWIVTPDPPYKAPLPPYPGPAWGVCPDGKLPFYWTVDPYTLAIIMGPCPAPDL
jgi:hypothetical protein